MFVKIQHSTCWPFSFWNVSIKSIRVLDVIKANPTNTYKLSGFCDSLQATNETNPKYNRQTTWHSVCQSHEKYTPQVTKMGSHGFHLNACIAIKSPPANKKDMLTVSHINLQEALSFIG